ncbi:hypothetical protein [Mesorhizobium sp.]|uniref:hypothetical protein n=1 Tax=Mesorhizobium sp. TaxID=1871066 RepID=UPI0025EF14E5|nr:hypothetical protein [Mesorhizobium sp.]
MLKRGIGQLKDVVRLAEQCYEAWGLVEHQGEKLVFRQDIEGQRRWLGCFWPALFRLAHEQSPDRETAAAADLALIIPPAKQPRRRDDLIRIKASQARTMQVTRHSAFRARCLHVL